MNLDDNQDQLVREWTEYFTEEVLSYSRPAEVSNEEVFSDVYHALIHSSMSETLLQLEHSHAEVIAEKCNEKDIEMTKLDERQAKEMSAAVERTEKGEDQADERMINRLAAQHMEERQMATLRWESDLAHARDTQAREFKEWVMCVYDEINGTSTSCPDDRSKKRSHHPNSNAFGVSRSESSFSIEAMSTAPVMQESFTITLGAQMKQMHNLRLVAADVLDMCKYPLSKDEALPQRLQTSMSLYSNNLCGLVLLTDDRISSYSGLSKEFSDLCQRSTEFHFPSFEQQLQTIKDDHVENGLKWREEHKKKKLAEDAVVESVEQTMEAKYSTTRLRPGDVYITKHSNLCEIHTVFHMVSDDDDSVMSSSINSRHPVIMGLRNVLKTASLSDVTSVTLPLLLTHEMCEEMTVQWCMKRAELVFKCVKGFMMEVSSWGGAEIKTLQFLVPKMIDPDVFVRLVNMLASIFRTSNPIRGK